MTALSQADLASAAVGGRRHRMSSDEVERAVLDTARDLLIGKQGGLTVSLEHINLEVIFGAAGVSRSSAFRRWKTKEDFVIDFLCDVAGPSWAGTAAFDIETLHKAIRTMQDNIDLLTESVDDRRRLIDEIVRQAAEQNYRTVVASAEWRTYVALTATVASMTNEGDQARIRDALNRSETIFMERMTKFYAAMAGLLGFRLKEPYTYWHLAAAGAAVVEGLALRHTVGMTMVDAPLPIPTPGGTKNWLLAAAGFNAILEAMIEMDPDYRVPTDEERAAISGASVDTVMTSIGLALDEGTA